MKQVLAGLTKVGWVPSALLPKNVSMKSRVGAPVAVLTDINWVEIYGEGKIEAQDVYDNHDRVETTTLTFRTGIDTRLPIGERVGWVARHPDGTMWLVGTKEPPFPTIEVTVTTGERDNEGVGQEVKVTCKGLKTLSRLNKQSF